MSRKRIWMAAALAALAVGCGGEDTGPKSGWYTPAEGTPQRIAYDGDLTRYLTESPAAEESTNGAVTTFTFDPADGPICMRGDPYRAAIRETDSDDLLIFLQGGGACWSDFCFAVTKAPSGIPNVDILNRGLAENPLADWDVLYLPYCDGSLFAGDVEIDEDDDGEPDRFQHGLANLSAALSVGHERFPSPSRVVLAGSSGGGFGTILAAFLVRYVYPDVPLYVIDDAGVGVGKADDPGFVQQLLDEWGAAQFVPADCPDCVSDGNITGVIGYLLDRDPNVREAAISSWYDFVISQIFMMETSTQFRDSVDAATGALETAHPDTYRRFIFDGEAHTTLLGDPTGIVGNDLMAVEIPPEVAADILSVQLESLTTASANGTMLSDWITAMVSDDLAGWQDITETPGPAP